MAKQQSYDELAVRDKKSRRLPADLVNPDGVYSGMARRNAFEDGSFLNPQEPEPPRRVKHRD